MSDQPKMLSERISFHRKPEELTVVITQQVSRGKEALLFTWLLAWFFVGSVFIYFWLHTEPGSSDRIFFAVTSAFWAYFFVKILKVYIWRKAGKELIRLKGEQFSIRNAYGKFGRPQLYHTDRIKKFGIIPYDFTKFGQFMDRASWVIGGEMLGFEFNGKPIRFGKQLSDKEAAQLGKIIEKAMREIPARHRRESKVN